MNLTAHKTVLIVDDMRLYRELIVDLLKKMGIHKVYEADNGSEALNIARAKDLDLVIMDLNMPKMNGYDTCREIRKWACEAQLPIIVITGRDKSETLPKAFEAGANDYFEKPFSIPQMSNRISFYLEFGQNFKRLSQEKDVLTRDLERARYCQKNSLPDMGRLNEKLLDNQLVAASFYQSSTHLSGDSWNILFLKDKVPFFYMVDVVGHGVNAAIYNAYMSGLIHSYCAKYFDQIHDLEKLPERIMEQVNNDLCVSTGRHIFSTALFAVYDRKIGKFSYASAAFPDVTCLRMAQKKVDTYSLSSLPLGVSQNHFKSNNGHINLDEGDVLMIMTDGLSESLPISEDLDLRQYGSYLPGEKLLNASYKDMVEKGGEKDIPTQIILNTILQTFDEHDYDMGRDDITALVLKKISQRNGY